MKEGLEARIQQEVRRRALERASLGEQQERHRLDSEANLEALEEITGLPPEELKAIENAVRASYARKEIDFFSIKNQLFLVILIAAAAAGALGLAVWLFFG